MYYTLLVAFFICGKNPKTMDDVFLSLCVVFDVSSVIVTDNGGEFENHQLKTLRETYDMTVKFTATESVSSSGVVERHTILAERSKTCN